MNSKLVIPPKPPSSDRSGPNGEMRSGFQAQIKGASLADLVQMECLAGSHRVVRVASGNHAGYLYFRGGAVVHAVARSLVGEAAALEMLSWNDGSFESAERDWPGKDTITSSWQSLLLRAAHARDERRDPSVVALRPENRIGKTIPPPVGEIMEFDATPLQVAGHVLRAEDFDAILRLDSEGSIIQNVGSSQDFADIVAYACRLTELIGNHLGAERFTAMECNFKSGRCFVVLERNGSVVALTPRPSVDAATIRSLLGL